MYCVNVSRFCMKTYRSIHVSFPYVSDRGASFLYNDAKANRNQGEGLREVHEKEANVE